MHQEEVKPEKKRNRTVSRRVETFDRTRLEKIRMEQNDWNRSEEHDRWIDAIDRQIKHDKTKNTYRRMAGQVDMKEDKKEKKKQVRATDRYRFECMKYLYIGRRP